MSTAAVMSLTSDSVLVELENASSAWTPRALGSLMRLATRGAQKIALGRPSRCEETLPQKSSEWAPCIERAITGAGIAAAEGLELHVLLGFSQCRVGLLSLQGLRETNTNLKLAVDAWVARHLHLDPSTQIVRWEALPEPGAYLVSCVRREVVEHIQSFASIRKIRLASIKPAVLTALESAMRTQKRTSQALALVCTEGRRNMARDGVVQVFGLCDGGLRHEWRGWVQPAPADSDDEEIAGLVRRFCAVHMPVAGEIQQSQFPQSLAGGG